GAEGRGAGAASNQRAPRPHGAGRAHQGHRHGEQPDSPPPVGATPGMLNFCTGVLVMIDPLFGFGMTLDGGSYNMVASWLGEWFFPLTFVLPGGWSCFLLWRAVRRLRLAPTRLGLMLPRIPFVRTLLRDLREPAQMRALGRQRRAGRLAWFFRVRNPLWLRSRLARVYDREGYIGRIQFLGWFAAIFFLLLM